MNQKVTVRRSTSILFIIFFLLCLCVYFFINLNIICMFVVFVTCHFLLPVSTVFGLSESNRGQISSRYYERAKIIVFICCGLVIVYPLVVFTYSTLLYSFIVRPAFYVNTMLLVAGYISLSGLLLLIIINILCLVKYKCTSFLLAFFSHLLLVAVLSLCYHSFSFNYS